MPTKFVRKLPSFPRMAKNLNPVMGKTQYFDRFRNLFLNDLPVSNERIIRRGIGENCIEFHEDCLEISFWNRALNKMRLYKLKLLWDPTFREVDFFKESKDKIVQITNILSKGNVDNFHGLTTTIGSYQIKYDVLCTDLGPKCSLLKFCNEDFSVVDAINVETHKRFGLRFAEIDVIFVGKRQGTALVDVMPEASQDDGALIKSTSENQLIEPSVFIKIFARFRRNYANDVESNGPWLISVFKILRLNVIKDSKEEN